MSNCFKIIVPFYNVEKWIGKTIKSVLLQDYDNYQCILANDMSTDDSLEICRKLVGNNDKFVIVDNKDKKFSLKNIYDSCWGHTEEEDIIVILDGDDFLANKSVLTTLDKAYSNPNCWLTYGSYINLSNRQEGKFASQIPENIIANSDYRNYKWCTSHLRTFKSFLFKSIQDKDFKDDSGEFFTITGDLAIMFPMLEMSGDHSYYLQEILYIWNDLNELNDHKKDNRLQMTVEHQIRTREKYDRIVR